MGADNREYYTSTQAARKLGVDPVRLLSKLKELGVPDDAVILGKSRVFVKKATIDGAGRKAEVTTRIPNPFPVIRIADIAEDEDDYDSLGRWAIRWDNLTVEHAVATPQFGWYVDLERCHSVVDALEWITDISGKTWYQDSDAICLARAIAQYHGWRAQRNKGVKGR